MRWLVFIAHALAVPEVFASEEISRRCGGKVGARAANVQQIGRGVAMGESWRGRPASLRFVLVRRKGKGAEKGCGWAGLLRPGAWHTVLAVKVGARHVARWRPAAVFEPWLLRCGVPATVPGNPARNRSSRTPGLLFPDFLHHRAQFDLLLANGLQSRAQAGLDPLPVVKLFTPDAGATWLLSGIDP